MWLKPYFFVTMELCTPKGMSFSHDGHLDIFWPTDATVSLKQLSDYLFQRQSFKEKELCPHGRIELFHIYLDLYLRSKEPSQSIPSFYYTDPSLWNFHSENLEGVIFLSLSPLRLHPLSNLWLPKDLFACSDLIFGKSERNVKQMSVVALNLKSGFLCVC